MTTSFNTFRATLMAACAAGLLVCTPGSAREFRSSDDHTPDYPTVEAVRHMDTLLKERSKGRLSVKVFPNGALGNERDTIEQLKIGGLDMAKINVAPLNNFVPETIVVGLPFVFRSTAHMRSVLDGAIGDEILAALETQGMVGLCFYDSGARSIYAAKKPIKSLADLKGMKIRVQQSDLTVAMVNALGANPTPMPFGEVYTALKVGIVDAAENNFPSYETTRHFEAAKYYSLTQHSMSPEILVFSKNIWDRLSKEDQTLIRQAAKDSVPFMRKKWDEQEAKSRAVVEAGGVAINEVTSKQEFVDAMKPVYAKFADGPKLRSLVERIQAAK